MNNMDNIKFMGIDLHSNRFTCCTIRMDGSKEKATFEIKPDSLKEFYKLLDENTYVMVEASTNTFKFIELIKDKVKEAYVANTHKLKLISMVKKKSDKIDAEKLALFLKMQIMSGEELIKAVYIPDQTIQDLRSLFTSYKLVRKHITSIKNRIHSILKQNLYPFTKKFIFGKKNIEKIKNLEMGEIPKFQIKFFFEQLALLEKRIKEIEDQIKIVGSAYIKNIDILTSMDGISVMIAIAIIADIATIERFPNSKHFTSYLRSAPGVDSSNETIRNLKTNKFGRKLSVSLITQSLKHIWTSNPKLNIWRNNKLENKKGKGKIRMALCRRAFTEIYNMLKKGEYHYWRHEELHTIKMNEYYRFLAKHGIIIANAA